MAPVVFRRETLVNLDLRVRVIWLTVFRTVATTLLLAVLAVRLFSTPRPEVLGAGDVASFAVIGTVYLLTLATSLMLRRRSLGAIAVWLQVVFDIILAGTVVYLTGGFESPFTFAFLLAIIGAAVLLGRRGAEVSAGLSFVAFSIAVLSTGGSRPLANVALEGTIQLLAQLSIAVLAAFLADQLSRTGGQLSARERDLRQITDLQNRIVAAMPSGLVTCDEEQRVTFANPAAMAILGLEGDPRGVTLEQVLPGASRAHHARRAEVQVPTPRGELTLGMSVTPLDSTSGALLVVFQDLTELRRLERELDAIDRLATLGRVSAQLAHEIRNPLASIRGSAQLIGSDVSDGHRERLTTLIMREADRLASLVDNYLKLARPPPPAPRRARLDAVVAETVEMLRADPALGSLLIEQRSDPIEASVDVAQLKQVLINLLRNAVSATGARGPVRVTVREVDHSPTIEVWDGAGSIPTEHQGRVFEPFFTTSEEGTGLGLTTVQSIVQAHGGSIAVTSTPDLGTTFSVKLPRLEEGA